MQVKTLSERIEENADSIWFFLMFLLFGTLFYGAALTSTNSAAFIIAGFATIMISVVAFLDEIQRVRQTISNLNLMLSIGSAAFLGAIYWINFM